jgi:hypothetical protein
MPPLLNRVVLPICDDWPEFCRIPLLWAIIAVKLACQVAEGLQGCTVGVKPFVIDTVPSPMAHTHEPTVSPVITMYKGLVNIDVQVTGSDALQVGKPPTCFAVKTQACQSFSTIFVSQAPAIVRTPFMIVGD